MWNPQQKCWGFFISWMLKDVVGTAHAQLFPLHDPTT